MPRDENLHQHIEQLHGELESQSTVDDQTRALLHTLMDDIRGLLGREDDTQEHTPESLIERLEEATSDFEAAHPTLYASVGRLIDTLSNLGI